MPLVLSLWGPLTLILLVPLASRPLAVTWYRRTRDRHDWANPDVLPMTAVAWLRDRAASIGVSVFVTDDRVPASQNAFHARAQAIQLTAEVAFKADPTAWAIAAHELGHAQFRRRHPRIEAVLRATQVPRAALVRVGAALAIGNALYALPGVTDLALALLVVNAVLGWYPLIEEAYASTWAARTLRDDPALTARHHRAIRATLLGAFGTYLVPRVATAFALSQWWIVRAITGDGRLGELAALTGVGRALMIAATAMALIAVAVYASARVRGAIARRVHPRPVVVARIAWIAVQVAVLFLTWNLHADAAWAWCVMLAMIPIVHVIAWLLFAPSMIALAPVWLLGERALRRIAGPGFEHSAAYAAARARGELAILAGNDALPGITLLRQRPATRIERALALHMLAFAPLVVAYWLR